MSAMFASSLNPDALLFVPATFRQVEDFSPQWWDLVKSSVWFRNHWYHEHQQIDDMSDSLLTLEAEDEDDPDAIDEDLFYVQASQPPVALKTDAVLKALVSPKGGDTHKGFTEKPRYPEKATKYVGSPRSGAAPRFIHQPC